MSLTALLVPTLASLNLPVATTVKLAPVPLKPDTFAGSTLSVAVVVPSYSLVLHVIAPALMLTFALLMVNVFSSVPL